MPEPGLPDPFRAGRRPGAGDGASPLTARLTLERLAPEVRGTRFAGRAIVRRRVSSTNEALQTLAREGAADSTFLVAEEQSRGRGRQGRRWSSPHGLGLYLSVLFRPARGAGTRWTLGAALAACDACRALGASRTVIKWPNDLLVGSEKVGGILVEARSSAAGTTELIVGLGVNVHHDARALAGLQLDAVTSLRVAAPSGIVGGRTDLAGKFLRRLDPIAAAIERDAWEPLAAAWLERAPLAVDAPVSVLSRDGTRWRGVSAGLADDGALRVRDAHDGVHELRQVDSVRFEEG